MGAHKPNKSANKDSISKPPTSHKGQESSQPHGLLTTAAHITANAPGSASRVFTTSISLGNHGDETMGSDPPLQQRRMGHLVSSLLMPLPEFMLLAKSKPSTEKDKRPDHSPRYPILKMAGLVKTLQEDIMGLRAEVRNVATRLDRLEDSDRKIHVDVFRRLQSLEMSVTGLKGEVVESKGRIIALEEIVQLQEKGIDMLESQKSVRVACSPVAVEDDEIGGSSGKASQGGEGGAREKGNAASSQNGKDESVPFAVQSTHNQHTAQNTPAPLQSANKWSRLLSDRVQETGAIKTNQAVSHSYQSVLLPASAPQPYNPAPCREIIDLGSSSESESDTESTKSIVEPQVTTGPSQHGSTAGQSIAAMAGARQNTASLFSQPKGIGGAGVSRNSMDVTPLDQSARKSNDFDKVPTRGDSKVTKPLSLGRVPDVIQEISNVQSRVKAVTASNNSYHPHTQRGTDVRQPNEKLSARPTGVHRATSPPDSSQPTVALPISLDTDTRAGKRKESDILVSNMDQQHNTNLKRNKVAGLVEPSTVAELKVITAKSSASQQAMEFLRQSQLTKQKDAIAENWDNLNDIQMREAMEILRSGLPAFHNVRGVEVNLDINVVPDKVVQRLYDFLCMESIVGVEDRLGKGIVENGDRRSENDSESKDGEEACYLSRFALRAHNQNSEFIFYFVFAHQLANARIGNMAEIHRVVKALITGVDSLKKRVEHAEREIRSLESKVRGHEDTIKTLQTRLMRRDVLISAGKEDPTTDESGNRTAKDNRSLGWKSASAHNQLLAQDNTSNQRFMIPKTSFICPITTTTKSDKNCDTNTSSFPGNITKKKAEVIDLGSSSNSDSSSESEDVDGMVITKTQKAEKKKQLALDIATPGLLIAKAADSNNLSKTAADQLKESRIKELQQKLVNEEKAKKARTANVKRTLAKNHAEAAEYRIACGVPRTRSRLFEVPASWTASGTATKRKWSAPTAEVSGKDFDEDEEINILAKKRTMDARSPTRGVDVSSGSTMEKQQESKDIVAEEDWSNSEDREKDLAGAKKQQERPVLKITSRTTKATDSDEELLVRLGRSDNLLDKNISKPNIEKPDLLSTKTSTGIRRGRGRPKNPRFGAKYRNRGEKFQTYWATPEKEEQNDMSGKRRRMSESPDLSLELSRAADLLSSEEALNARGMGLDWP
ncbi:hypothetical protein EJ08DRAFT_726535 [Tothia fuscella]|uniref:NET domain-containing protein n=1 Tax=Tothia fuscella TaxID=1048955 RepID=A0A9P4NI01_9PEZI|nr:hypothetical protein EJ08DRAFT_726535 [Tothia fuscella]